MATLQLGALFGWILVPRLVLSVVAGRMAGPVFVMIALNRAPASSVALLLNLKVVFAVILAGALFGEHLGLWMIVGACLVAVAGGALG